MVPAFRSRTALPFAAALLAVSLTSGLAAAGGGTPAACTNPGQVVTQTEQKFSAIAPGAVVAVGNALGLSKAPGLNAPGTVDSIGTFIAIDGNASTEPGWFAGTTGDWMENGATATLELPSEATILHAQLVWGGSYADPTGLGSLEANLEDPVVLRFGGQEFEVMPEGAGIDVELGDLFRYYARSADVTDIVTGEGALTVGRVPAKQSDLIDSLHAAGWTLLVAYRDQTQPIRNLTIYFGGEFVDENTTQDYRFSGFCASPSGDLTGSAIITALEGDANRDGDVLCIAPTDVANPPAGSFVGLSAPNNPADNFFASQINDANGELDTTGTFGTRNHNAFTETNTSGGRQGWDITQVQLSSGDGSLEPDQTGATMRTATADDSYLPMSAAFSIDVLAPLFVPGPGNGTEVSVDSAQIGDTFTVTVELTNTGEAAVNNLVFTMPVESGLTLTSFTSDGQPGDITGDPVQQSELNSGVAQGSLAPSENRTVVATFEVTGAPSGEQFLVQPSWGYDWVMCTGQAAIDGNFAGEVDSVLFIETTGPTTTSGAGGDDSGATTSTGSDGTGGAGGGGDDSDGEDSDGEDEDGAGGGNAGTYVASGSGLCAATPGAPGRAGLFALGLAAIGAALGLRRRRA